MGRNRLYDEDVLVIGLGRFGAAAALELHRLGHKDPRANASKIAGNTAFFDIFGPIGQQLYGETVKKL